MSETFSISITDSTLICRDINASHPLGQNFSSFGHLGESLKDILKIPTMLQNKMCLKKEGEM